MTLPQIPHIQPGRLFLIDSMGALLSAIMLGLVLTRLESVVGMPPHVLYFLAMIAGIFSDLFTCMCAEQARKVEELHESHRDC